MNDVVVVLHNGDPDAPLNATALARVAWARSILNGRELVAMHPLMGGPLGPTYSTREEALTAAAFLLPDRPRITLVTSASHSPRATRVFERVGFTVSPAPMPWPHNPLDRLREWWYEVRAVRRYERRGWI